MTIQGYGGPQPSDEKPNGNREAGYNAARMEDMMRRLNEIEEKMDERFDRLMEVSSLNRTDSITLAIQNKEMKRRLTDLEKHTHPALAEAIDGLKRRDWAGVITGLVAFGTAAGTAVAAWLTK